MLIQISINNFALIDDVKLEFEKGLNVLTGETGAGKSIIIGALKLCLGERADMSVVRDLEKPCRIECVFSCDKVFLKDNQIIRNYVADTDEYLVIRREFSSVGQSKTYINNYLVNLSVLKQIGSLLVDLHGQYDHQLLLNPDVHIEMLDRFGSLLKQRESYSLIFEQYSQIKSKLEKVSAVDSMGQRRIDVLKYQIDEIEKADIKNDEEKILNEEQVRLSNSQKLNEIVSSLIHFLEETESSVSEVIRQCFSLISQLNRIDPTTSSLTEILTNVQIETEDLCEKLRIYRDGLAFDDNSLNEISKRIDLIEDIKRKYGLQISDVNEFLKNAKSEYEEFLNKDGIIKDLQEKLSKILGDLKKASEILTSARKIAAMSLKKEIEIQMKELGMASAVFQTRMVPCEFNQMGSQSVEFFLSPNVGEEPKPMAKIASAGEAARVMLALKKVLAEVDGIPVLIFDEIDSNIGGRLGNVIGKKLKEVSLLRQVILITHLPQIASFADKHIGIYKTTENKKTFTRCVVLDKQQRVEELAKMMAGDDKTKISIKHAQEMLQIAGGKN